MPRQPQLPFPASPAAAPEAAPAQSAAALSAALARAAPEARPEPLEEFFYRPDEDLGELAELSPEVEAQPSTAEEPLCEYLGIQLAGEQYALALERIREIVKVPPITEVPRAPSDVMGVMSLRGEVMPVFDLRRRLNLPQLSGVAGRRARVVIVDVGEGPAGILVDAVEHVVRLPGSSIEPPPPGLGAGVDSEYLAGIGREDGAMYVLLNLTAVLRRGARRGATR